MCRHCGRTAGLLWLCRASNFGGHCSPVAAHWWPVSISGRAKWKCHRQAGQGPGNGVGRHGRCHPAANLRAPGRIASVHGPSSCRVENTGDFGRSGCYRRSVTLIRRDELTAGTGIAPTAALSWLESVNEKLQPSEVQYLGFAQPRYFRSYRFDLSVPSMDERPDRKQGPENNSHRNHSFAVCAARNVV